MCDPKEAANVATKIASMKDVYIVVGHLCSSATLSALPIYKRAKIPAISPASTNITIGRLSRYYFRNVYRDDFQGKFLAKYADKALHAKKIVIFYENNDYSIGLKDAFVKEAKRRGLKILGKEAYTQDDTDFKPILTKYRAMRPDVIFIPGYAPQGTLIISQARELGFKSKFMGADGLDDKIMLQNPDAEGLMITTPFIPDKASGEAAKFIKEYKDKFKSEPNWFAANSYDAVMLAAQAIKNVGKDREKIRAYLAGINSPEKAFKGITGATYFDKYGDCQKPAFIKIIKNGKWVGAEVQIK
jgi:branched-chain amino acid transport system substrate-binding protein